MFTQSPVERRRSSYAMFEKVCLSLCSPARDKARGSYFSMVWPWIRVSFCPWHMGFCGGGAGSVFCLGMLVLALAQVLVLDSLCLGRAGAGAGAGSALCAGQVLGVVQVLVLALDLRVLGTCWGRSLCGRCWRRCWYWHCVRVFLGCAGAGAVFGGFALASFPCLVMMWMTLSCQGLMPGMKSCHAIIIMMANRFANAGPAPPSVFCLGMLVLDTGTSAVAGSAFASAWGLLVWLLLRRWITPVDWRHGCWRWDQRFLGAGNAGAGVGAVGDGAGTGSAFSWGVLVQALVQ